MAHTKAWLTKRVKIDGKWKVKQPRERISEAFGASEDVFRQTFKFKKGDWLLMSYDATGLEAIPIPIHTEDANARIRRFLDDAQRQAEGRRQADQGRP